MTDKPVRNIAASVRQRLLSLRTAGGDYNALLTQFAIERFLYRLCQSPVAGRFILKGAMLFRVWSGPAHRPTKDLDLLGRGEASPNELIDIVRLVAAIAAPEDGLVFDLDTVTASEIRQEQEYGGVQVKLVAMLGNVRIPMQIDVGFGDAVNPRPKIHTYPTLLGMDAPRIRMYPPQTVVSEKLHVMVARGATNSRMKDFHDLLVIFRIHEMSIESLARAIAATFQCRKTALPEEVPPGLSNEFGNDPAAQRMWREFLRRHQINDVPEDFGQVMAAVRQHVWPAIEMAGRLDAGG